MASTLAAALLGSHSFPSAHTGEPSHGCAQGSVPRGSLHWDCDRPAEGSMNSGGGWEEAHGGAPRTELLSQTPRVFY